MALTVKAREGAPHPDWDEATWGENAVLASVVAANPADPRDGTLLWGNGLSDFAWSADGRAPRPKEEDWRTGFQLPPGLEFWPEMCHNPHSGLSRSYVLICGNAGSGKTIMAYWLIKSYRELWPKREIVLVTNKPWDDTIKIGTPPFNVRLMKPETLIVPGKPLKPGPHETELHECLLVFDDVEDFRPDILAAIETLLREIGNKGRSVDVSAIQVTHLARDWAHTRVAHNEATMVIAYPARGNVSQLAGLLKTVCGLNKDQITSILQLESRWICLHRSDPAAIVTNRTAYVLPKSERKA